MKADRFTVKAGEALSAAQAAAERRGHPEILPEHLLAGLLDLLRETLRVTAEGQEIDDGDGSTE